MASRVVTVVLPASSTNSHSSTPQSPVRRPAQAGFRGLSTSVTLTVQVKPPSPASKVVPLPGAPCGGRTCDAACHSGQAFPCVRMSHSLSAGASTSALN